jgi:hypothetical protein
MITASRAFWHALRGLHDLQSIATDSGRSGSTPGIKVRRFLGKLDGFLRLLLPPGCRKRLTLV